MVKVNYLDSCEWELYLNCLKYLENNLNNRINGTVPGSLQVYDTFKIKGTL